MSVSVRSSPVRPGWRARFSALNSSICVAASCLKSADKPSSDSSWELSTRIVFGRAIQRLSRTIEKSGISPLPTSGEPPGCVRVVADHDGDLGRVPFRFAAPIFLPAVELGFVVRIERVQGSLKFLRHHRRAGDGVRVLIVVIESEVVRSLGISIRESRRAYRLGRSRWS